MKGWLLLAITLMFVAQNVWSIKVLMYSPRFGKSHVSFLGIFKKIRI